MYRFTFYDEDENLVHDVIFEDIPQNAQIVNLLYDVDHKAQKREFLELMKATGEDISFTVFDDDGVENGVVYACLEKI